MSLKKEWRKIRLSLKRLLIPLFAKHKLLASLYYLVSGEFMREQHKVLLGKVLYEMQESDVQNSSAMLRRNIHRIEKGLIMRPLKPVFAADYIGETVEQYAKLAKAIGSSEELYWASDVIERYFSTVTLNEYLASLKVVYEEHRARRDSDFQASMSPYLSSDRPDLMIGFDEFSQLCKRRRSVRWFKDVPVEKQKIVKAARVAAMAPSACNRQPYSFLAYTEKSMVEQVASIPMGTVGFDHNFPCIVAVVGDLSAFPEERDRHVIYIDASLASMQFMLALETLGLSSCPINWPDIEKKERQMETLLKLKPSERVVMLIALGEADPDGGIPFSQKQEILKVDV